MITKILQKYDGFTNYWYPDIPHDTKIYNSPDIEKYQQECEGMELKLQNKYKNYIPPGWYGFLLSSPIPKNWFKIIDEFLEYLLKLQEEKKISDFQIHQVKLKFGGLRFYVSYECKDQELREFIELQISKLENYLFDNKLIY